MYAQIRDNIVVELIPEEHPDFPGIPISERYSSDFLALCEEVEDDIGLFWIKQSDGTFVAPPEPPENLPIEDPPPPSPSLNDMIAELQDENKVLAARAKALSDRSTFLEECLIEMSIAVYGDPYA